MEKSKISCLSRKKWECNCAAISVRYFCCEKDKRREIVDEREGKRGYEVQSYRRYRCTLLTDCEGRKSATVCTKRLLFQTSDNHYLPDAMVRDPCILVPNTISTIVREPFIIVAVVIANNNRHT